MAMELAAIHNTEVDTVGVDLEVALVDMVDMDVEALADMVDLVDIHNTGLGQSEDSEEVLLLDQEADLLEVHDLVALELAAVITKEGRRTKDPAHKPISSTSTI